MTSTTADHTPIECWEFVRRLLSDVQAEEEREELAAFFGQWRLSIKAFRRAEAARITMVECPTDTDLLFHRACVAELISLGTLIEVAAMTHTQEDLAKHDLRLATIRAYLQDLHNTFDEWHGQVPDDRVQELRERIFHAAPEFNF